MIALGDAFDAAQLGGKAVQLGAAIRAELPVPGGLALSVLHVEAIVRGDGTTIAALDASVRQLGGPVAVRSSAIGEDSASASFAGQHSTCLNVAPTVDAVRSAVREVWESGRTESALAYRRRLGLDEAPRVAVVVQIMVAPTVAGVLFTTCPSTGADHRVIEAAWGLGEAVVAGLVTPDRFRLDRAGQILERAAGYKDIVVRALAEGGTEEVALDDERAQALCLDDAALLRLHRLAERCEEVYGGAQDIEWAFVDTELFLLQRRPITQGARAT